MNPTKLKSYLNAFSRSWTGAPGTQMATLVTLTAAYSILVFALSFSINLRNILASWGETVQLTAYLKDSADSLSIAKIEKAIREFPETAELEFISREKATELFRVQMSSYAPDLLSDKDFANPFPASFRVKLKGEALTKGEAQGLADIAAKIEKLDGVEDASFGETWAKNYAGLMRGASALGWILAITLIAGAIFVVGNSIRSSLSARREEIEIMELVGATSAMIRAPYIFEGFLFGLIASVLALVANFSIWLWGKEVLSSEATLTRMSANLGFLSNFYLFAVVVLGSCLGAFGGWMISRSINTGWAASQTVGRSPGFEQ